MLRVVQCSAPGAGWVCVAPYQSCTRHYPSYKGTSPTCHTLMHVHAYMIASHHYACPCYYSLCSPHAHTCAAFPSPPYPPLQKEKNPKYRARIQAQMARLDVTLSTEQVARRRDTLEQDWKVGRVTHVSKIIVLRLRLCDLRKSIPPHVLYIFEQDRKVISSTHCFEYDHHPSHPGRFLLPPYHTP